jgi:hypothetical protein
LCGHGRDCTTATSNFKSTDVASVFIEDVIKVKVCFSAKDGMKRRDNIYQIWFRPGTSVRLPDPELLERITNQNIELLFIEIVSEEGSQGRPSER